MSCLRCGRKLKNKESKKRGYGSYCYKKVKEETKKDYEVEQIDQEELEGQENFIEEIRRVI